MMVVIFACMFISLLIAWFKYQRTAIFFFVVTVLLTVWLFLFEIYSPIYGFAMPWIQT